MSGCGFVDAERGREQDYPRWRGSVNGLCCVRPCFGDVPRLCRLIWAALGRGVSRRDNNRAFSRTTDAAMWNAVLILWATGAWIQTVTAQPGVGVPVPRLVVHTPRRALYAGSPVTFDAGWTTLPSAAGTYYYHFQFGDMDAAGVGKRQSVTKQGVPPSVTHVYERPGSYVANVTVSDVAFVDTAAIQGTVATSTASTGYAPLVATVLVDIVSANSECYEYSLSQPAVWNATCTATTSATSGSACLASTSAVSGKVTLDLLVKDPTGTYSSLAAAYNSIGDTPRVVVTNHTHTIEIESSSLVFTGTSWSFSLNASSLAGSISPMIARVESKKSGILSCAVQDTTLDLSVPRISNLGLGYDMSQTETGGAKAGLALRTGAYRPQYLRVAMNVCVKTQALAVFSAVSGGPSLNGLGALVATSADGFGESASLWNLARDSDGSQTTSRSLCGAAALTTAQCQELNVIDAVIVDSAVVLVSSVGVFVSNAIPLITTPAQSASLANYTLVRTGNAIVDAPGASVSKVSVYGRSDCLQPNIGRVFVTFPSASSAGSPVDSLIYATSLTAVMAGTFTTLTVSSIAALLPSAGLGASHSFVAVEHDTILSRHIYLFGIHRSAGCIGRRCSYTSPVIILHDPSTAKFIAAATLPTTLVVTGLKLHADGVHSVLFGSQIWVSQDGGQYWMQVYDLTPPTNVVTETFVDMESTTQGMGGIALITSSNRVFYGSVSALEFVAARTVPDLTGSLAALVAEGTGRLSVLTTDTVPTYGGTSVTYPSGFLADSAGSLRSAILKRLPIPGDSVVGSNADESFAATLVPVLLSSTRRGWSLCHRPHRRLPPLPAPSSAHTTATGRSRTIQAANSESSPWHQRDSWSMSA
ncbi:hypothetical protein BC831DRAFT_129640 [Entophlyctis helioformis]|nr:hypothetical protein BC831DRAFT_129640 [Entophlyctis helioformis]